jgi:hypothetical protein
LNLVVVVGASLALGGALAGAIVPQSLDTMRLLNFNDAEPATIARDIGTVVLVGGVVCALAYFAFGALGRRSSPMRALSAVGRWVLVIAFGAVLGSLAATFYAALIERFDFLTRLVTFWLGY